MISIFHYRPHVLLLMLLAVWAGPITAFGADVSDKPAADHAKARQTQTFEGAWFDVAVPRGFTVKESLKSTTKEGYDSVELISPDDRVSFYVFAPQWSGDPKDIALDPDREILLSEREHRYKDKYVRLYTIADKAGLYRRSYRDTLEHDGSERMVVGFKYRGEASRQSYLGAYNRFVKSIRRYSD